MYRHGHERLNSQPDLKLAESSLSTQPLDEAIACADPCNNFYRKKSVKSQKSKWWHSLEKELIHLLISSAMAQVGKECSPCDGFLLNLRCYLPVAQETDRIRYVRHQCNTCINWPVICPTYTKLLAYVRTHMYHRNHIHICKARRLIDEQLSFLDVHCVWNNMTSHKSFSEK